MKIVAIIPSRANSKGVPGKNMKLLGGYPLVSYTLSAALLCDEIDRVIVTSESETTLKYCRNTAKTIGELGRYTSYERNPKMSQDHVQNDEVVVDVVRWLEWKGEAYDAIVLLQPTSPFRSSADISGALEIYTGNRTVVSAYKPEHLYHWRQLSLSLPAIPVGHNPKTRQGRQWEEDDEFVENGAIYIVDFSLASRHRCVRVPPFDMFEMDKESSLDINTPADWSRAEAIIASKKASSLI